MKYRNRVTRFAAVLLAAGSLPGWAAAPSNSPYRPQSADTILLERPAGSASKLRAQRGSALPMGAAQRAAAAELAIDRARRTGDPRYFGQAQALLGASWTEPMPPPAVRLVRATLLQQRHDFTQALVDLDAVLAAEPGNAQARLIRANVRMVQGLPQQARRDCAALIGQSGFLVIATCLGSVNALSGAAASGLQTIETALAREPGAEAGLRIWALTQAAEIAERLGDAPRATEYFATALAALEATGDNDVYLKAAYADFLLAQRRATEVKALLAAEADFDPLLLRLALAESQLAAAGDRTAAGAAAVMSKTLQARYALSATRGDPPHRREQGMATLHLQGDAEGALEVAASNWQEQREPADALLLMQAAIAAGNAAAAQPVLDWLQQTGIEDVRLKPLAARLVSSAS